MPDTRPQDPALVLIVYTSGLKLSLSTAGDINRDKLGDMVFNDRDARSRLNSATHLPVALELVRQLAVEWLSLTSVAVSGSGNRLQPAFRYYARHYKPHSRIDSSGGGYATSVRDRLTQVDVAKSICHMQS